MKLSACLEIYCLNFFTDKLKSRNLHHWMVLIDLDDGLFDKKRRLKLIKKNLKKALLKLRKKIKTTLQ